MIKSDSVISFDYNLPKGSDRKKFIFDGERLYLEINLGNLAFFNSRGAKEIYNAYKIELHFPSEHYITMNGQTPRYAMELQIFHKYVISSNPKVTNEFMKVNQAVISILYSVGTYEDGDELLEQLGISSKELCEIGYNFNRSKEPNTAKPNENISQKAQRIGHYDTGFTVNALQGLLNALNSDPHIYYYYGSETVPPCREEVLWFIFGRPRSISKYQFKFLKKQLAKSHVKGKPMNKVSNFQELFGNKRRIQLYNDKIRGKIFSNLNGVRQVKQHSFFKNK